MDVITTSDRPRYNTLRRRIAEEIVKRAVERRAEAQQAATGDRKPVDERARRDAIAANDWHAWVDTCVASYASAPFARRHIDLWDWLTALTPNERPRSRVEIWPRGGAKSTSTELGCVWACERKARRFVLYVCGTQDQADKHVQSIATILEEIGVQRALNLYGLSKGWRHSELRTANDFNVVAYGLDSAMRGIKIDKYRPDLIVFDDIDDRHDAPEVTKKKIEAITQTVLPAGSHDCAVLFIQNRVHSKSVASQLADGVADFMLDRVVTEEPAVRGLKHDPVVDDAGTTVGYRITHGSPTWEGQGIAICEQQMSLWGVRAFEREAQHVVGDAEGALWRQAWLDTFRVERLQVPDLIRVGVGVDPPGSSKRGGAEAGIVTAGIDARVPPHLYVVRDDSLRGTPDRWASASVKAYHDEQADKVVGEINFGGEMVEHTIKVTDRAVAFDSVHASRGKAVRAEPIANATKEGRVHLVGYFPELEGELTGWVPGIGASPNRLDAMVWIATYLGITDSIGPAASATSSRDPHAARPAGRGLASVRGGDRGRR